MKKTFYISFIIILLSFASSQVNGFNNNSNSADVISITNLEEAQTQIDFYSCGHALELLPSSYISFTFVAKNNPRFTIQAVKIFPVAILTETNLQV